jgi:hypothetical protein
MAKSLKPIGKLILKNYAFLKALCRTRSDQKREELINSATREQLLSLVEVCSNILSEDFPLNKRQRNRLCPFAPTVRQLARARSERRARDVIRYQQTGGGAPALLAALLAPVLVEAAQHLISSVARKNP